MTSAAAVASVAAVAFAAAVASVASVAVAVALASVAAVAAEVAAAAEVAVGATVAVAIAFTTSDLTRFRLRHLNFLNCIFHYTLEVIFRNFNNSFLTSDISLQATVGI